MARSWSSRARRDFRERAEYRKEHGEKDRYEKTDEVSKSAKEQVEDAKEDRLDERGWSDGDYENALMQLRNATPDDDVTDILDRLRERYRYYEQELDRYDADYDSLAAEVKSLREDNARYMLREGAEIIDQQTEDIKLDTEILTDDELWKTREG